MGVLQPVAVVTLRRVSPLGSMLRDLPYTKTFPEPRAVPNCSFHHPPEVTAVRQSIPVPASCTLSLDAVTVAHPPGLRAGDPTRQSKR